MMLMHVPGNGKNATIISFPRDSYVAIPGHGMAKLNAAYPDGYSAAKAQGQSEVAAESAGVNLLGQTLQNLTGLTIDHYIMINLLGFYRISNAIGGVPVVLCQAQKESNSGINLPAGLSNIQGTQALAFVRQRDGLPLGDLNRIQRQQYFLKSVFHKLTSSGALLNPFTVKSLLDAVSSSLLTDGVNLLNLADTFSAMAEGNITYQTIPDDGINGNEVGRQRRAGHAEQGAGLRAEPDRQEHADRCIDRHHRCARFFHGDRGQRIGHERRCHVERRRAYCGRLQGHRQPDQPPDDQHHDDRVPGQHGGPGQDTVSPDPGRRPGVDLAGHRRHAGTGDGRVAGERPRRIDAEQWFIGGGEQQRGLERHRRHRRPRREEPARLHPVVVVAGVLAERPGDPLITFYNDVSVVAE